MSDLFKQQTTTRKLIEFGALQHVADDIHRRHSAREHPERQTIVQGQGKILLALLTEDHVSQKDLATKLNLTAQSTAEFVRKLEKKKFVTREKSITDRRVTLVSLTPMGRKEASQTIDEIPPFLEVLDDRELDQLAAILTKINTSMYDDIAAADPTWFNKFHQMLTGYYSNIFHQGEHRHEDE